MQVATMMIQRKIGKARADVPAGTCFTPANGDELAELTEMGACRDATEDEIAVHERRNKPGKKRASPAKKADTPADTTPAANPGEPDADAAAKAAAPKAKPAAKPKATGKGKGKGALLG